MVAAALLAVSPARAQLGMGAPPEAVEKARAKWPDVHFEITTPRSSYALGEEIPLTMRYRNDGKPGLRITVVTYDRSGRIMEFGFEGKDVNGQKVRDPYPFQGGMMGGIRTEKALGQHEQTVSLNEWLSFDHPGHYEITAWSGIVQEVGPEGTYGPLVPLRAAPLELDISAPDEPSRQARLDAARLALDAAEKRAASLPTTQDRYERDRQLGPQAGAAMRDLRWMTDPRAIPLLLRGLALGGDVAFEAHRGLVAFPDLAPVRAAVLLRLKSDKPIVESSWALKDLLARSSPSPQKQAFGFRLSPEDEVLFNAPLRAALARDVTGHNTSEAARDAATLLQNDAGAPGEATVWRAFWPGAASLSEEQQWAAALLLLQEKERAKTYPVTIPDLRRAARDGRLGEQLRSAAVIALAARGGFSLRPLLAEDVTAPKTHFSPAAFATLGDFEARPIALKLLQALRVPDTSSAFAKDDLAARVRDFGGGATRDELVEAARWMMVHFPPSQGPLLEAVALRDPQSALVLIRESLAKHPAWEWGDARLGVLARLDLPAAREQVRAFLGQKNENFLMALVGLIGESTYDDRERSSGEEGHRRLRAPRALSESLVPELARLDFTSPSAKVRQTVESALREITQLRANPSDAAQVAVWRTDLRAWWNKNAARLGRPTSLADSI